MKKILLIFALILTAVIPAMAQGPGQGNGHKGKKGDMAKEINEFKLKFLAQEMELKEDQQKRFFELYDQMSKEKWEIFKEMRDKERKVKNDPNATDEDYKSLSDAIADFKAKDAQIDKKYDDQFATFLTQKQIFKMKDAEEKFRQKMHEMRGKRKNR